MAKEYDLVFKENLKTSLIKLLDVGLKERFKLLKPLPVEFAKQINYEADFVFEAQQLNKQNQVEDLILHLEIQTKDDKTMLQRMYLYGALLFEKYNKPVKQICIFLGTDSRPVSMMRSRINMGFYEYQYKLVSMASISYKHFLKNPETLLFAILGKFSEKDKMKVVKEILGKAKESYGTKEQFKMFIDKLILLAKLRKLESTIKTLTPKYMPFDDLRMEDTETYQEGKREGKEEVAKSMLLNKMSKDLIAELTGLSLTRIEELKKEIEK